MMSPEFPYVTWRAVAERDGVVLREAGRGDPLVFIPGMTGGGQATLALCLAAAADRTARPFGRAASPGAAGLVGRRVLWLDYTHEAHATLEALQDTLEGLVRPALGRERCTLWAESLGCLVAHPRFDASLQVRRRVLISAFGGVPQFALRLGLAAMAITPGPIYRRVMRPIGRVLFGPAGDRPDHVFFAAVAETPACDARRRGRWLVGRRFDDQLAAITAPTKVWLGARDRLINVARERALFTGLSATRPGFELAVVARGGHVVTDTAVLAELRDDVAAWLALDHPRAQELA